ncbi:MAG: right-handed parallel beta-helix repeat-containing protein, partial [Chloroflexota bacterium]|nr:right-handed parallel beta-helix repeat-containing protein [Chloroflexota bacterium]
MNDDIRLGRLFEDGLHDIAPLHAPDRLRTQVKTESSRVRPRPRWLALIKESPMRTNSRLAVGSPTARVAAIMVATLLIAAMVIGASFAGAQIFAADGSIIVDPSGDGDFTTIADAVAAAEDGDEILVRPGTYIEAVVIEKNVTIEGDGPVEEIVITASPEGPTALVDGAYTSDPYAILLVGNDSMLANLTFRDQPSGVLVQGGSPILDGLVFDSVGYPFGTRGMGNGGSSIVLSDGSTATVIHNDVRDGGPIAVFAGSTPIIEGNSLTGGPHIYLSSFGDGTVVTGNTIDGTLRWAIGVFDSNSLTIDGNVITDPGTIGINLSSGSALIRGNSVSGASLGAIVVGKDETQVIGNTLADNAVSITGPGLVHVEGNDLNGGGAGIVITAGSPAVKDNSVTGMASRGIVLTAGASPTLSGNTACG